MDASADRITQAVAAQPPSHVVIVAAHNGPTGLGTQQHAICGADFLARGGALCSGPSCMRQAGMLSGLVQRWPVPCMHLARSLLWLPRT